MANSLEKKINYEYMQKSGNNIVEIHIVPGTAKSVSYSAHSSKHFKIAFG
jgi:hypothetical protein